MMALYHTLVQYKDETGRNPIGLFMEKPSKKEYPDYYHVITEPIDMKTIEQNIRNDKYSTEDALMKDFVLMFDNARRYNEEGSMVYEDANLLEALLKEKFDSGRSTPIKSQGQKKTPVKRSPAKSLSPLAQKLNDLFNAIRDYTDQHARELSPPFIRLPSKNEYPEYYQVIKRPMDMQRIQQKILSRGYDQLEDMVGDFLLMFDNACKFNEPDSLIYKDALTLQRILLQTKTVLTGDETSGVPDVQGAVREILTSLFVSLANHQDEEGRCYSDSLAEIPHPVDKELGAEDPNVQRKPLDLDTIRRYLDRGCYRRLDCFQDHIFEVMHRARNLSRTDSQVYEDSIEMQRFFIQIRDEICKNGEILLSPALSYTFKHLQNDLDEQKKEKIPKEMKEDSEKKEEEDAKKDSSTEEHEHSKLDGEEDDENDDGLLVNGVTYRVGDFVYVEPSEKQLKNHIVCIEKLWRDSDGEGWLHGNWFLRPNETFHLATRKFLEKEVFKSDYYNKVKISQHVLGKCFVMFVKDFFKHKPEGFEEEDVFVCESRYSAKAKNFKKIKIFAVPVNSAKIVSRDEPLSKVRIASVFAESPPAKTHDLLGEKANLPVFDKEREDVLQDMPNDGGLTYYEQVLCNGVWFKLGDAVYIKVQKGKPHICKIDKIWKDLSGEIYILGPVFIYPSATVHPPTRLFYRNEIFLSSMDASYPINQIIGKCGVMVFKDYISSRPTEFGEKHVYVCESQYKEAEQCMRKIKGLKLHKVANKVIDDEIYFFKKPITPLKEPSPLLRQELEDEEMDYEDEEVLSEDKETEEEEEEEEEEGPMALVGLEVGGEVLDPRKSEEDALLLQMAAQLDDLDETASVTSSVSNTPKSSRPRPKKDSDGKPNRNPSGFIIFAGENRAAYKRSNPDMSFGDISRDIGQMWRNLPKTEKQKYMEQAAKIAASRPKPEKKPKKDKKDREREKEREREREREREAEYPGGMMQGGMPPMGEGALGPMDPMGIQVYECGWDGCDHMFEDMEDLVTHVVDTSGHLRAARENLFSCCWKTCTRFKKSQPFPVYSRLVRHCKEVHMKHAARLIHHHQLSRNYYPKGASQPRPSTPGSSAVMGVVGPPTPVSMATQQINQNYGGGVPPGQQSMAAQYPPMAPPQPMFVSAPPKTQRLLHSEAYIKYIEGLNNRSDTISEWKHNLDVSKQSAPLTDSQKARLPRHWFAPGVLGEEEEIVDALWKMRDIMLHDSLSFSKAFRFESAVPPMKVPEVSSGVANGVTNGVTNGATNGATNGV